MQPHHGEQDSPELKKLFQRFDKQGTDEEEKSHSEGRLVPDDEGDVVYTIGLAKGQVVIDYGKPVVWIAMGASDARMMAEFLIDRADSLDHMKSKVL